MIQLVCSIFALAGSWLAFKTGGIAAGALDNAIEYGRIVRRTFWYVLYLITVGLAAVYLSASIMLLAWALTGSAGSSGVAEKNLNRWTVVAAVVWFVLIIAYGILVKLS